jgi:hypothetical protein
MSSERDSFAKGIFSTFAKGFLLHKLLLKVNYSPLRVKKSRSHDMGQWPECFYFILFLNYDRKSAIFRPTTIFQHIKQAQWFKIPSQTKKNFTKSSNYMKQKTFG